MTEQTTMQLTCFGEALMDLLPHDGEALLPIVGGAPANAAVGFAKLGGHSAFLGGLSNDAFGQNIAKTLQHYGVDTAHCPVIKAANTALAVVQLDEHKERQFSFYRQQTADISVSMDDFNEFNWPQSGIYHFCSNTLTDSSITATHMELLKQAKAHGQIISFDVNLRLNLWRDLADLPARVEACFSLCDILKFSLEELEYLSQAASLSTERYIQRLCALGVQVILVSDGKNPVQLITSQQTHSIATPSINAVDTTGAGDSLISGFLFALAHQQLEQSQLNANLEKLIDAAEFAVKCGAFTCTKLGAMPALPTYDEVY